MAKQCDHSIGRLTRDFSPDEGIGSTYDLAADFADDEKYAVYVAHHEMAKAARSSLGQLATGMKLRIEQLAQKGGE